MNIGKYCKEMGIRIDDLVYYTKIPRNTIYRWWVTRPEAIKMMVLGVSNIENDLVARKAKLESEIKTKK